MCHSFANKKVMERVREHFANFYIAGFTFYDGAFAFNQLSIGTEVKLVAEPSNKFDKNAVAIYHGNYMLGYIPRSSNREVSKMLNAGYNVFTAVVQGVYPQCNPEEQVRVAVFINRNNA